MTDSVVGAPAPDRGVLAQIGPLLRLVGRNRGLLCAAVASGLVYQLAALGVAATSALLVGRAITGADVAELTPGLVALGLLVLPLAIAPWAESQLAHVAAFRILADIRGRLYDAFERLAPGYLLRRRSGDLGAAAMADVEQLELYFAHTLSPIAVAVVVPGVALAGLGAIHPWLAAAMAPVLVLLATVPAWLRRKAAAQGRELKDRLGEINAEVVDAFQGLRELVTFGAEKRQLGRMSANDSRLLAARRAHGRRSAWEESATDAISVVGLLAVLVIAGLLVRAGRLEPSHFPVAVVLAATTFAPVIAVTDAARDLNLVAAATTRVEAILNTPAAVVDHVTTGPAGPITPEVTFDRVSFRYGPGLPYALQDVSFSVAPGETVAIVGHSGAGKSTCVHCLLRMWDVDEGAIRVGGHDIREFPQHELRRLLAFVPQDVYLFNESIRDNIRLGRPNASDEKVEAAAAAARAHEFIAALPSGYDTVAGEIGSRLSGGQRQRIAIARALLTDAPILVLDEAVSNLDATSEVEVVAAMNHARADRTTLVIAHRLSTIKTADRIVVLEHGRQVESGTHAALLGRDSAYRRLVVTQTGGLIGASPDQAAPGSVAIPLQKD